MKTIFGIFLLLITLQVSAKNFDYISQTRNVFECFGDVDFNEYSPGKRNQGFDLCKKAFKFQIDANNCHVLADRYYGLAAKNQAINSCLENAPTFSTCLQVAGNMPAQPSRQRAALVCLDKFIHTISKDDCLHVGWSYKPIEATVNQKCEEYFAPEELELD